MENFDKRMTPEELEEAVSQYKSQGYDENDLPYKNLFAGEETQDFYLGMTAALAVMDIAFKQQDTSEVSMQEIITWMFVHSVMFSDKTKPRRIITF